MKNHSAYGSLAPFFDISSVEWSKSNPLIFSNPAPLEVEIGFGTGEYLAALAVARPEVNFVGFEQCPTRIIKTLSKLHQAGAANVRVCRIDAVWAFRFLIAQSSVDKVHCLFPCPWPKKKHAKHRLFNSNVLRLARSRLKEGGTIRIVTDHHPYADWIEEQLPATGFSLQRNLIGAVHGTKFEKKWQEGGQDSFTELILRADLPYANQNTEVCLVKTYLCKEGNPQHMLLEGESGKITISFPEQLFDPVRQAGIVHAIVSEDNRMQHVWVTIEHSAKGWYVSPAAGTAILPTEGIKRAIELVFRAVEKSVKQDG